MAPPAPPPARPKLPPIARAALLLDMDGTLLDIAPTPEAVVVPPDLIASLRALRARLDGMLEREGRADLARAAFDFLPARVLLDLEGWAEQDIFAH